MKKLIYSIYGFCFGFIIIVSVILIILSIIININIGVYGSLALVVLYILGFNFSSIVLSKSKLKYHGKEVTKEIEQDIIKKVFWRRGLMFGMAISAFIALIFILVSYLI